jgi:hypothetical protein
MRYIILISVIVLSGCASISSIVPSFWDDNQSAKIVDVRLNIERVDCVNALPGVSRVRDDLTWFALYSESKGVLNRDMIRLVTPMQETVEDWHKRTAQGASVTYCELKKSVMRQQAQRAAGAVLGRW